MRVPLDRRLARRALRTSAPSVLAAASAALTISSFHWLGLVVGCAALAVAGWTNYRNPLGRHVAARAVVAAGFFHGALANGADGAVVTAAVLLLMLLLHEAPLRVISAPRFRVANLHVAARRILPDPLGRMVWLVEAVLVVTLGVAAVVTLPSWPFLVLTMMALALSGMLFVDAWNRRRGNRGADLAVMRDSVERLQPRFLLHFSSVPGMEYQATMWLPYLERIGEPFVVVLRESDSFRPVAGATRAPVVVCPSLAALDAVMVDSLRAVFYVNNGMKNSHSVRFAHLDHIQLLHGDSDKAPSFNPVTAMFDKVFVAGQAAIDRYANNGVHIPPEKFRVVGRPQVEGLTVAGTHAGVVADPVVLYAPTWIGLYNDVNYCSLPIGEVIIRALLERGVTVIFRPHPFTNRDRGSSVHVHRIGEVLAQDRERTGREHRWGDAATDNMSLFDCINASDALVSDVSSVVSDYLFTGKPFAITDMVDEGADFLHTFPLASAAYVLRRDASNLTDVFDQLLRDDPLAERRTAARTHYLGDFPPERYADAFLIEARRCLADGSAHDARVLEGVSADSS